MADKSSFFKGKISKEDAIIQLFRPQINGQITQGLDVFERLVVQAEMLTKLGTKLQSGERGAEAFFITPEDLRATLDEFEELEQIATEGRALLTRLGYVSLRYAAPITGEGTAPVGKTVQVTPITVTQPGSEPVTGVVLKPKGKQP